MGSVLRCVAVSLVAVGLWPAAGLAATVARDPDTGVITIVGNGAANDDLTVERAPSSDIVVKDANGGLSSTPPCTPSPTVVTCPSGTSIAADLGDGDDRYEGGSVSLPTSVAGGPGTDQLRTGGGNDVLAGGDGNDVLEGRGGVDEYFGETGDDTVEARDNTAERISCGAGADVANNDFVDIIAECERGIDGDRDGFSTAIDCNDAAAGIFPGAGEVFDNGVDENCDGRDNPNLDVDRDGFPRPQDCDDGNAAIRPTAREVRGNKTDENCDRRALPFADLGAVVANQWVFAPSWARLQKLVVHNAPKGARVVFRCFGRSCPTRRARRRTVPNVLTRVVLHRGFRKARLRPGTRLQVAITAAGTIGRTYTYTVKRGEAPASRIVCRRPGAKRGRTC